MLKTYLSKSILHDHAAEVIIIMFIYETSILRRTQERNTIKILINMKQTYHSHHVYDTNIKLAQTPETKYYQNTNLTWIFYSLFPYPYPPRNQIIRDEKKEKKYTYIPSKMCHGIRQTEDTGTNHGGDIVEGRVPPFGIPWGSDWKPSFDLLLPG